MKSSHCPKYEQNFLKNSTLSVQGRIFQIFRSYFGQWGDFIISFRNLLTFRKGHTVRVYLDTIWKTLFETSHSHTVVVKNTKVYLFFVPCVKLVIWRLKNGDKIFFEIAFEFLYPTISPDIFPYFYTYRISANSFGPWIVSSLD